MSVGILAVLIILIGILMILFGFAVTGEEDDVLDAYGKAAVLIGLFLIILGALLARDALGI